MIQSKSGLLQPSEMKRTMVPRVFFEATPYFLNFRGGCCALGNHEKKIIDTN